MSSSPPDYQDRHLTLQGGVLTIHKYYFPTFGPKRVAVDDIVQVTRHPMTGIFSGRGRLHGGTFTRWLHWDLSRFRKDCLFVLDVTGNGIVHPTVTPDNPDAFVAALKKLGVEVTVSDSTTSWW